jgi:hypothetical protein
MEEEKVKSPQLSECICHEKKSIVHLQFDLPSTENTHSKNKIGMKPENKKSLDLQKTAVKKKKGGASTITWNHILVQDQ